MVKRRMIEIRHVLLSVSAGGFDFVD